MYILATKALVPKQAKESENKILNVNYKAIDLESKVKYIDQLESTALRFLELYSGSLGIIDIKPIHLKLKEGSNPVHAKACPVPEVHKIFTKNESK